jgi:hypothetical protein
MSTALNITSPKLVKNAGGTVLTVTRQRANLVKISSLGGDGISLVGLGAGALTHWASGQILYYMLQRTDGRVCRSPVAGLRQARCAPWVN